MRVNFPIKKIPAFYILCAAALLSVFLGAKESLSGGIYTSPASIFIHENKSSAHKLRYKFNLDKKIKGVFFSNKGIFKTSKNIVLFTNPKNLQIQIKNGMGNISERIIVKKSIISKAIRLKENKIFYERIFVL